MSVKKWFSKGGEAHRGWYKGLWMDSSWELAFAMYYLDKGIEIVRNTRNFPYVFKRKLQQYRPDFIVDGVYYEIKGVMDGRSKRKIESFPYPLKVVRSKDIKPYIQYAEARYGKHYWELLQES